jgi:hypothetical protein
MKPRNHTPRAAASLSEQELFHLFAQLPRWSPGAGFVDRVMLALPRRSWLDSSWTRGGLAAALLGVALATALLVPTLFAVARLAGPATLLNAWVSAVGDLFLGLGESLGAWERIADLGRAFGKALAQPRALVLILANVAVATAAFRGLLALAPSPRKGTSHAVLAS